MNIQIQENLLILMENIKKFYTLSLTGHLSSTISGKYKQSTMKWEKDDNCYKGYLGLRLPTNDYRKEQASMEKATDFSHKLYNLKTNYIEREFLPDIDTTKWEKGRIIDFLSRCRIARYADCHGLALESAILLNHIKSIVKNKLYEHYDFKVVRDSSRGHTFLIGRVENKTTFLFDAWENTITEPNIQFKFQYGNKIKEDLAFTNFAKEKCEYHANEMILNAYMRNIRSEVD